MKLNSTHLFLVCADDVNILGGSAHTVKGNAEALVVASKKIRLEVNANKTVALDARSPLCSMQIREGWVRQNTIDFTKFITLTTCFGRCGPSSGHKTQGRLYVVYKHRYYYMV